MADVRLTATNPEDSSVVPVACDAAGRLLLEEPQVVEGPPGPDGEQGPPGQNGQDGDPFSGNFAGDVTFGGSAEFAGSIIQQIGKVQNFRVNTSGSVIIGNPSGTGNLTASNRFILLDGEDGSAEFAGIIETEGTRGGFISGQVPVVASDSFWGVWGGKNYAGDMTSQIKGDGSAAFAGNKAGFTKEGHLYCTTTRGETVMLDFTANGMGQWIPYTPTTRLEEMRDKLDANRGDTGEMPADTP